MFSTTISSSAAPRVKPPARGFTDKWIADLPHGVKRYEVGDPVAPGLRIRVAAAPGKAKTWVWYAVAGGKSHCVTFDRFPDVSVDKARARLQDAKQAKAEEAKRAKAEGRPAQLRTPPPPVAEGALLVSQLAEDYYRKEVEGRRRHPWRVRSILDKYIVPTIGHLEVKTLTTPALRAPTEKAVAEGSPVQAAAVLQITKALSRHAANHGPLAFDVGAPLRAKTLHADTSSERDRVVEDAELPLLLTGLKQLTDPTQTLLRLLLTTGVRTGELLNAPWSEFDLEEAVWTIPPQRQKLTLEKMKKAKPWRVPLAPSAVDMLEHLKKLAPKSKWVAASNDKAKSGHVTDKVLSHALRRLQGLDKPTARVSEARAAERAAEPGKKRRGPKPGRPPRMVLPGGQVNAHDFRRTLSTWLQDNGCATEIAERCLGHKVKGVRGKYARSDFFDQRREWLTRWAEHLAAVEAK